MSLKGTWYLVSYNIIKKAVWDGTHDSSYASKRKKKIWFSAAHHSVLIYSTIL